MGRQDKTAHRSRLAVLGARPQVTSVVLSMEVLPAGSILVRVRRLRTVNPVAPLDLVVCIPTG